MPGRLKEEIEETIRLAQAEIELKRQLREELAGPDEGPGEA
jgi:hypothetical protein